MGHTGMTVPNYQTHPSTCRNTPRRNYVLLWISTTVQSGTKPTADQSGS